MLFIDDFRTMLDQIAPHISTDESLPMLCEALVEATEDGLLLVATDRYTLAVTRHPEPSPRPWTAFLTGADIRADKVLAAATRTRAARIAFDGAQLVLGVGEPTLTLPDRTETGAGFPRWRAKVRTAVEAAPNQTDPVLLDSRLLGRWHTRTPAPPKPTDRRTTGTKPAPERGGPLAVWSGGPEAPLVIARGEHFLGVQMPLRHAADPEVHPMRLAQSAWRDALIGPQEPTAPAALPSASSQAVTSAA